MMADQVLAHQEQQFPAAGPSCREARNFVTGALAGLLDDGRLDNARVATSELAGNAIKYAPGAFRVAVDTHPGYVEIHVVDSGQGPTSPQVRGVTHGSEGGRGLFLITELTDGCGTRAALLCRCGHDAKGSCTWFRINLPSPALEVAS